MQLGNILLSSCIVFYVRIMQTGAIVLNGILKSTKSYLFNSGSTYKNVKH